MDKPDILERLRNHGATWRPIMDEAADCIERLDRAIAAKDDALSVALKRLEEAATEITTLRQTIAARDAEIERLRAALKPLAWRCQTAVRPDDAPNDGVTVKTIDLRNAHQAYIDTAALAQKDTADD